LLKVADFLELSQACGEGGNEPQEAFRCTGSAEVKMSVCGGGVYAEVVKEREGYSSNVR
jgi:hypothetical protein